VQLLPVRVAQRRHVVGEHWVEAGVQGVRLRFAAAVDPQYVGAVLKALAC
jgi:hypothetical protein